FPDASTAQPLFCVCCSAGVASSSTRRLSPPSRASAYGCLQRAAFFTQSAPSFMCTRVCGFRTPSGISSLCWRQSAIIWRCSRPCRGDDGRRVSRAQRSMSSALLRLVLRSAQAPSFPRTQASRSARLEGRGGLMLRDARACRFACAGRRWQARAPQHEAERGLRWFGLHTLCAAMLCAAALALSCAAVKAQAQHWPSRPVKIIAPFAAGGAADTLGRVIAEHLSNAFQLQFSVENRGGGGGAGGPPSRGAGRPAWPTTLSPRI